VIFIIFNQIYGKIKSDVKMIKISSKSGRKLSMECDKTELFIRHFIDSLMGRGESLDIFKLVKTFQSRGNGGAWYIEKLSSKSHNFNKAK
jgi:hypothetical protein